MNEAYLTKWAKNTTDNWNLGFDIGFIPDLRRLGVTKFKWTFEKGTVGCEFDYQGKEYESSWSVAQNCDGSQKDLDRFLNLINSNGLETVIGIMCRA